MVGLNFFRDWGWACASILLLNWKFESTDNTDYGLESQQFGQQIIAMLSMLIPVAAIAVKSKIAKEKVPVEDILVYFFAAAAVIYAWDYAAVLGAEKGSEWFDLTDDADVFPNTGDFAAFWTGLFEGPGQLLVSRLIQMMIRAYHSPKPGCEVVREEIMDFLAHPGYFLAELGVSALPLAGATAGDIWQLVYNRFRTFNTPVSVPRAIGSGAVLASTVGAANVYSAKVADVLFLPNELDRTVDKIHEKLKADGGEVKHEDIRAIVENSVGEERRRLSIND